MADFGVQVAQWLSRALVDDQGLDKLPRARVAKKAGISPDTLYAILRGERGGVEEGTLRKLAETLGVPAPAVVRSLASEPAAPVTPLAAVKLAQDALERARALLEEGQARPADRLAAETPALVQAEERLTGREPPGVAGRRKRRG